MAAWASPCGTEAVGAFIRATKPLTGSEKDRLALFRQVRDELRGDLREFNRSVESSDL